eukprot:3937881-Rhodomonas_salina.3
MGGLREDVGRVGAWVDDDSARAQLDTRVIAGMRTQFLKHGDWQTHFVGLLQQGMRITQKKNRRTGADQTPAVLPNEKLADEMPQVEEALEERALPAAREHNKALQKMQHEREPTVQKMPKNDNRQTRAEGRIGQPRPGF